jgi:DNA-binding NtrC family response regulator
MRFQEFKYLFRGTRREYDLDMNFSNPILICDENEEFRILIRDMLTKNGFFHVVEASNAAEAGEYLRANNDYLVLIDSKLMTEEIFPFLQRQKDFIFFAEITDAKTALLAAKVGVHHIMSYPFHSRKLMEKINSLL